MFESFLRDRGVLYREGEPLAEHTTFRIGGPAEFFVEPADPEELRDVWVAARDEGLPVRILGGGANLLARDGPVPGVVVSTRRLADVLYEPDRIVAGAGASFPRVVGEACRRGLAGLEGLAGIPGTVGGALLMNAGGRHGEIGPRVEWADVVDGEGEIRRLPAAEIAFRYRGSSLAGTVILGASFRVEPGEPAELLRRFREVLDFKYATQPMSAKCAGCMFTNPPGDSAGRLVEAAGFKGAREGGARVSPKHANFIVNEARATASDVLALAERIRAHVAAQFHRQLDYEVIRW